MRKEIKFNLKKLRGKKIAVNCRIEEQAKNFVDWVVSLGVDDTLNPYWNTPIGDTCYKLTKELYWYGVSEESVKNLGYGVISYEDALLKDVIETETYSIGSVTNYIDSLDKEIREKEKLIKGTKILKCKQDFIKQFRDCVRSVGGDTESISLDITLQEMCDMLAQNGVTFTTHKVDI